VLGVVVMNSQLGESGEVGQKLSGFNPNFVPIIIGSLLTTTGLVFNLDSFRHLR
jgi:hypothetical protein